MPDMTPEGIARRKLIEAQLAEYHFSRIGGMPMREMSAEHYAATLATISQRAAELEQQLYGMTKAEFDAGCDKRAGIR